MSDSSVWLHRLRQEKRGFSIRQRGLHWEEQSYLNLYGLDKVKERTECGWTGGYTHVLGHDIFVQCFIPERSKGTAVICHGYYDHTGLYGPMVECLLESGFTVLMFDQPGHGLSSGMQASIDNFGTYSRTLEHVTNSILLRESLPGPHVLVGQSMGGAVIMEYLTRHADKDNFPFVDAIVLAPLVRPKGWTLGQVKLRVVAPFVESIKRVFKENSHDPEFLSFVRYQDPLQSKRLTTAWVLAMKEWMEAFIEKDTCDHPLLVLQGTDEKTVDAEYNLPVIQELFPKAEVVMVPEARHHMIRESERYRRPWITTIKNRLAELEA